MINRESVELGLVLKQIDGYDFSMSSFPDRLRLQKIIYLLQAFKVYLGYDFSWYLRGPYCSKLAHNGFSLQEVYDVVPDDIRFKDRGDRKRFGEFLKFIAGKDIDDLEIAVSLHYLKAVHKSAPDDHIQDMVIKKERTDFTPGQVSKIWKEMKEKKLV